MAHTVPTTLDKYPTMYHKERSANKNIVLTTPTVTLWSGALKYGIRGYNEKGMAWRWCIPYKWNGVLTQNLLDFLALERSIHMDIQKLLHGTHVPIFMDISSAKAYFNTVKKGGHDRVAQWLGWKLVSNKVSL